MESEGPYFITQERDGQLAIGDHEILLRDWFVRARALGESIVEKEIEEKKAMKDTLFGGTGFMKDGKRVPPEDVYLSETEIKLKKAEKDFKELLEWANDMAHEGRLTHNIEDLAERFYDWKKERGLNEKRVA